MIVEESVYEEIIAALLPSALVQNPTKMYNTRRKRISDISPKYRLNDVSRFDCPSDQTRERRTGCWRNIHASPVYR